MKITSLNNRHCKNLLRCYILAFLLLLVPTMAFGQLIIECTPVGNDLYRVKFQDQKSGNESFAWEFVFNCSQIYLWGEFITSSISDFEMEPEDNTLEIKFKTIPVTTLTFKCSPDEDLPNNVFNFSMWQGVVKPSKTDSTDFTLDNHSAYIMFLLSNYAISEIRFNGSLLPGLYPTKQDFKTLFDTAARQVPENGDLSKYLAFQKIISEKFADKGIVNSCTASPQSIDKGETPIAAGDNRPMGIPVGFEVVKDNELYSGCIYKNYNCPLLKKTVSEVQEPRTVTLAELIANPLGLKEMTWTNSAPRMLMDADNTGLPVWGYYQHVDDNGWTSTKIEFPKLKLAESFRYGNYDIELVTVDNLPSANILSTTSRRVPSMYTVIQFNPYLKNNESLGILSKKEMKKFNKEFMKFFSSFIDGLRRQGFNFPIVKNPETCKTYETESSDGKRCTIEIDLSDFGHIDDEKITIHITD